MAHELQADVLILGGGIAGLWTLARLRREGFECVLVESGALGGGQTIASQGIIHGGLKYALDGQVGGAAAAIAAMPGVWRSCLAGEKDASVDLRGVPVLSEHYYYWTSPGVLSRLAGAGASKVMRTAVEHIAPGQRPELLRGAPTGLGGVDVYRVGEMVLDSRRLVEKLAEIGRGRIVRGTVVAGDELKRPGGAVRVRCFDGRELWVRAGAVVLAAGAGNEELLVTFGMSESARVKAQTRPLHMVMLRGAPSAFFGHCVGTSSSPRLTITSGTIDATGEHVWYIGGQIAESGVARSEAGQIVEAKREMAECMPWLRLPESTRWATLRVDRAEGVPEGGGLLAGMRPDLPVVVGEQSRRVIAAWPTKLAFAPLLADEVVRALAELKVLPRADGALNPALPPPPVAQHVWDAEVVVWN